MFKINVPKIKSKVDSAVIKYYGSVDNIFLYSMFFDKTLKSCPDHKMRRPGVVYLLNVKESNTALYSSSYFILQNIFKRYNLEHLQSLVNTSKAFSNSEIKVFDGEEPIYGKFSNFAYSVMPQQFTILEFVAAGYTNVNNPNLISSLGYQFNYEKI